MEEKTTRKVRGYAEIKEYDNKNTFAIPGDKMR